MNLDIDNLKSTGPPRMPQMVLRSLRVAVLWILACLALPSGADEPQVQLRVEGSGQVASSQGGLQSANSAYLLVIDHSGSMNEDSGDGRSRWAHMQARASAFIDGVPEGSLVWVALFEGYSGRKHEVEIAEAVVSTPEDRVRLKEHISAKRPGRGKTALFDTLSLAFDRALALKADDHYRHGNISILVYTDISGDIPPDKNPEDGIECSGRFKTLGELKHRYFPADGAGGMTSLKDDEQVWLYEVRLDNSSSGSLLSTLPRSSVGLPKVPVPVRIMPRGVVLESPRIPGKQVQQIQVQVQVPKAWREQSGKADVTFTWVGDGEKAGAPKVGDPQVVPLGSGGFVVSLQVLNPQDLEPGRVYEGNIRLELGTLPDHAFVTEGSRDVHVRFDRAGQPPQIFGMEPKDGSVRAGSAVRFSVETLKDAHITWRDLTDDGQELSASDAFFKTFRETGDRIIELTVQDLAKAYDPVRRQINLRVVDMGVMAGVPSTPVYADQPFVLNPVLTGARDLVKATSWYANGERLGTAAGAGAWNHPGLPPGKYLVQAQAMTDLFSVLSEPVELTVHEVPGISFLEPPQGAILRRGHVYTIKVEVTAGGLTALQYQRGSNGGRIDLAKDQRQTMVDMGIPLNYEQDNFSVQMTGIPAEGLTFEPPTAVRTFTVVDPDVQMAITSPVTNATLTADHRPVFAVAVSGPSSHLVKTVQFEFFARGADAEEQAITSLTADVKASSETGQAHVERGLDDLQFRGGNSMTVRLKATALAENGMSLATTEAGWKVEPRKPPTIIVEPSPARWNRPVQITLSSFDNVTDWRWSGDWTAAEDFGASRTITFTPSETGTYDVNCQIEMGGQRVELTESFQVVASMPTAVPELMYNGSPRTWLTVGAIGALRNADAAGTDHVRPPVWLLDGKPLPVGDQTVLLDEMGFHTISLAVFPPPTRSGPVEPNIKTLGVRVAPPWWIFALLLLPAIYLFVVLFNRYVRRNELLSWRIRYATLGLPRDQDQNLDSSTKAVSASAEDKSLSNQLAASLSTTGSSGTADLDLLRKRRRSTAEELSEERLSTSIPLRELIKREKRSGQVRQPWDYQQKQARLHVKTMVDSDHWKNPPHDDDVLLITRKQTTDSEAIKAEMQLLKNAPHLDLRQDQDTTTPDRFSYILTDKRGLKGRSKDDPSRRVWLVLDRHPSPGVGTAGMGLVLALLAYVLILAGIYLFSSGHLSRAPAEDMANVVMEEVQAYTSGHLGAPMVERSLDQSPE